MRVGRSGVTLIELLVVTVIIGILALLAAPQFEGARRSARLAVVRTDLESFARTAQMYQIDRMTFVGVDTVADLSPGVQLSFVWVKAGGLLVRATHRGAPGWTCWYRTGHVPPGQVPPANVAPERVVCLEN